MRTREEYINSLGKLRKNIYLNGKLVDRLAPEFEGAINTIGITYDTCNNPEFSGLMTAKSHLTGKEICRFLHVPQKAEDLLAKQKMIRTYVRKTGFCINRCMGGDVINGLSSITYDVDKKYGTEYNKRFLNYLKYLQEKDLYVAGAQTDMKGDRKLRPHEQPDPDQYLRIVERKKDGIVVRGAKCCITDSAQAEEIIVIPTRAMTKEEGDWAVSFAVPADTERLYLSTRASSPRKRKKMTSPFANFGSTDSLLIFDDVFVPWERVFLAGETAFAGSLAVLFALYHRHSYTGCKPAVTEIILGLTALASDYNGVGNAPHIREKLSDMIGISELIYSTGLAAAMESHIAPSGTCIPNVLYCNVGRRFAGENIYHEHNTLVDIAGGLSATLPTEEDFHDKKIGPLLNKYMTRRAGVSAENIQKVFRGIGDMSCSGFGAVWQIAGVHGGGSPIMESIAIMANYDLEARKKMAKELVGITKE
jgi:aromatic ring hydroxylase